MPPYIPKPIHKARGQLIYMMNSPLHYLSCNSLRTFDGFAVIIAVSRLLIFPSLHFHDICCVLVLQQFGFLCHQSPRKGQEWKYQHHQERSTENETSPPRPYPFGVTRSNVDLKAKHVYVILQQQCPKSVSQDWAKDSRGVDESYNE